MSYLNCRRLRIESVGIVDESYPVPQLCGQTGQAGIGRVCRPEVCFVDDQIRGLKKLYELGIVSCVARVAQNASIGFDTESTGRNMMIGSANLDLKRAYRGNTRPFERREGEIVVKRQ